MQAGTSTLFNANGGSIEFKGENYEGQVGAGYLDGQFRYGGLFRTQVLKNTLSIGDDVVPFELPTDVFGGSHYFLARGIGLLHTSDIAKAYAFVGATSQGFATPFFTAAGRDKTMSVMYFDRKLNSHFTFVSRSIFSAKRTSIHALEWRAREHVKIAAAAGFGSNQGYGASSLVLDGRTYDLRLSYVQAGKEFERIRVPALITSELEKENITFTYRPKRGFTLSSSHQNVVQPAYKDQPTLRAKVDEVFTTINVAKFSFGGGLFNSRMASQSTLGTNLFAGRNLTSRLNVTANLFHSRPSVGEASNTLTGTVRFVVNQKLTISQVTTRSNGQTTAGVGGEILTNFVSAHVGYETVYAPFRLDKPFQQALSINASLNLPGNLRLTVASFVSPTGELKRTIGVSRYIYRAAGMAGGSPPTSFRFPRFVVQGRVVDPDGKPIEGAAIHVGGQIAYTDAQGVFMLRLGKRGPYKLEVALDEFIAAGTYRVISAPETVTAEPEDSPPPVRIVLERVRPKPVETDGPTQN